MGELIKAETSAGTDIVSYGLWAWRAEYSFYAEQNIRIIDAPPALRNYWEASPPRLVLVEEGHVDDVRQTLGQGPSYQREVGSRTVYLFSDHPLAAR